MQVGTPWRKAQTRLEGEDEYEALDKVERLEVFTEYIKYVLSSLAAMLIAAQLIQGAFGNMEKSLLDNMATESAGFGVTWVVCLRSIRWPFPLPR